MSHSILLASPSTLLTISLRSKECSFWLSHDRKFLMIEDTRGLSIAGLAVQLTKQPDSEIISTLRTPIRSPSSLVSLHLDIWLPLIFESGETIKSADEDKHLSLRIFHAGTGGVHPPLRMHANHECSKRKKLSECSLTLIPTFSTVHRDDSLLTEIYSDVLKIGSTSIAVSRELLSLHSDFFSNLFYGNFMERNQEVKEIKDISEPEFVDFIQCLHRRRFKFGSVRRALDSLGFADRFLMPKIGMKVLPYLKNNSIPEDFLGYALIVADRMPNNGELLAWILTQFPSKSKLLEVLHSILPSISAATAQMCLEPSIECLTELENEKIEWLEEKEEHKKHPDYVKMRKLMGNQSHMAGIHLLCYDSKGGKVTVEDFFCAEVNRAELNHIFLGVNRPSILLFWQFIPAEYSTVIVNGATVKRNQIMFIDINVPSVLKVQAYRN